MMARQNLETKAPPCNNLTRKFLCFEHLIQYLDWPDVVRLLVSRVGPEVVHMRAYLLVEPEPEHRVSITIKRMSTKGTLLLFPLSLVPSHSIILLYLWSVLQVQGTTWAGMWYVICAFARVIHIFIFAVGHVEQSTRDAVWMMNY